MTRVLTDNQNYHDIAEAIREKLGVETEYLPSEMAEAIGDIQPQGTYGTKTITANGTYDPIDDGVDAYSSVTADVQPTLQSKTATENGTVTPDSGYDGLSSVIVNVSGGGSSTLVPKTITTNGTYNPADDNADGYSSVIVNVPSSGGGYTHAYATSTTTVDITYQSSVTEALV